MEGVSYVAAMVMGRPSLSSLVASPLFLNRRPET
jgi:hypothetical protein